MLTNPTWIRTGAFGLAMLQLMKQPLASHIHSQCSLLFKLSGSDTGMRVDDRDCLLTDTSAIFLNAWQPHAKLESSGEASLVLHLRLESDWLQARFGLPPTTAGQLFPQPQVYVVPELRTLADWLAAAIVAPRIGATDDHCEEVLTDLMALVIERHADRSLSWKKYVSRPAMDFRITRAIRHMRAHPSNGDNLDDVAAIVGLSRSHFYEQFKKCVGVSPHHYVRWTRMVLAFERLGNTDQPMLEVSDALGFKDQSHFARFFKMQIGLSPSEFRRLARA